MAHPLHAQSAGLGQEENVSSQDSSMVCTDPFQAAGFWGHGFEVQGLGFSMGFNRQSHFDTAGQVAEC